jgi:hypothetical protein
MGWLGTLGAISGAGFMLAPKGCVAKSGPPRPVHRTEHPSGAPIVACSHVRTGHPGGGVYSMGLSVLGKCRGCRACTQPSFSWRSIATLWSSSSRVAMFYCHMW